MTRPKSLKFGRKRAVGRSLGKVTTRHHGGGAKRLFRVIDFKRDKRAIPARVESFEYDPNRSADLALLLYEDGERRFILRPEKIKVGDQVVSDDSAPIKAGNALPIAKIPIGTEVHNVELTAAIGRRL